MINIKQNIKQEPTSNMVNIIKWPTISIFWISIMLRLSKIKTKHPKPEHRHGQGPLVDLRLANNLELFHQFWTTKRTCGEKTYSNLSPIRMMENPRSRVYISILLWLDVINPDIASAASLKRPWSFSAWTDLWCLQASKEVSAGFISSGPSSRWATHLKPISEGMIISIWRIAISENVWNHRISVWTPNNNNKQYKYKNFIFNYIVFNIMVVKSKFWPFHVLKPPWCLFLTRLGLLAPGLNGSILVFPFACLEMVLFLGVKLCQMQTFFVKMCQMQTMLLMCWK